MKIELSSLDLYFLMPELKVLEGSRVDRIYHSKENKSELIISTYVSNVGKKILRIIIPRIIFIDDSKENAGTPTGLCMILRKYLEGSRIRKIEQKEIERIITITFENKGINYTLIIELFNKGNIIFLDNQNKILNLLEFQHWQDRELKVGITYTFPKSSINPLKLSKKDFLEKIKNSDKDSIVKTLAIDLSIGGKYAESILDFSKIDKKTVMKKDSEIESLYEKFIEFIQKKSKPTIFQGKIYPFKMVDEAEEFNTISEILTKYYNISVNSQKETESRKFADKIIKIIEEQEKKLKEFNSETEENQKIGEEIYSKYSEIKEILEIIKSARKKYGQKEILEKIKNDPKYNKIILSIENNTLTIDSSKL